MSLIMPHGNMIIHEKNIMHNADHMPSINMNIIKNAGSCGCAASPKAAVESFSTQLDSNGGLNSEKYGIYEKEGWDFSTKLYMGSLTVIGLYVLFRSMQKSM